jgi:hypothetical protein
VTVSREYRYMDSVTVISVMSPIEREKVHFGDRNWNLDRHRE